MYLRGVNIYNQMFSNYNSNPHQEMWNICGNEVCAGLFWNLIEGGDYRSRVLGNLVGYARQAVVVRWADLPSHCAWPSFGSKAIGDTDIGDGRLPIIIIVYRST